MKDNLCLVTGGFDPIHQGHVEYIKSAKEISSYLVIGLNSDDWLLRKKNYVFMPWKQRAEVLKSISYVDEVISFDDSDGSAYDAINVCLKKSQKVIFANGGDRNKTNIPELELFKNSKNVDFKFSVGGDLKIGSSSSLTSNFYNNFTKILNSEKGKVNVNDISSPWGFHNLVVDNKSYKVKILSINPKSQLSMQKHQHREEHWIVVKGNGEVVIDGKINAINAGEYIKIPKKSVHCVMNTSSENMVIIEIQLGEILKESDIERISDIYGRVGE